MKIIYKERQSGKTTELIKMADMHNGYIICHSRQASEGIFRKAKEMGLNINYPMTYKEFLDRDSYGPGVKVVYIDNVDAMLQMIVKPGVKLEAITMSKGN